MHFQLTRCGLSDDFQDSDAKILRTLTTNQLKTLTIRGGELALIEDRVDDSNTEADRSPDEEEGLPNFMTMTPEER